MRPPALAAIALLVVACATAPNPSPSASPAVIGFVELALEVVPDATQFFGSQHRARVVDADGSIAADWEITDGGSPVAVPAGTHQLQAFTVFLSDFLHCSADPAAPAGQRCVQPTLGPAKVCAIPMEVAAGAIVRALYRSLPGGDCQLVGLVDPDASPPAVTTPPAAEGSAAEPTWPPLPLPASACRGDRWPPYGLPGMDGIVVVAIDAAHATVSNETDRDWSYRLSGWEVLQLDTCVGLVESELQRGIVPAHGRADALFGFLMDRPDVPVTLGIWDGRCGEACFRKPIAEIFVPRSGVVPGSS